MKYPDWKELESGNLSPAERADLERLLAEDEGARLDFAAYQEYRMTLRQAVLSDSVGDERLEAMLKRAAPARRSPFRWVAAASAGLALVAFAVVGPQFFAAGGHEAKITAAADRISIIDSMETNDPDRAAEWVNRSVDFRVPKYRLDGVAKMVGAAYGKDFAAYEFESSGKQFTLIVRQKGYKYKNCREEKVGKRTFFVGKTVGWDCPSCSYEIVGGDDDSRMVIAKAAAKELFGSL